MEKEDRDKILDAVPNGKKGRAKEFIVIAEALMETERKLRWEAIKAFNDAESALTAVGKFFTGMRINTDNCPHPDGFIFHDGDCVFCTFCGKLM